MSSTKRASTLPKPPTSLSSTVVIADTASLLGTNRITIRDSTVIQPRAVLSSSHGQITIGSTCIVGERVQIGLQTDVDDQPEGVVIEDAVVIEANAVVEARKVGMGSTIEVGAVIKKGAVLGKYCKVGPMCRVEEDETIPDHTVIFGSGMRRKDDSGVDEMRLKLVSKQSEILRKLVSGSLAKWQ